MRRRLEAFGVSMLKMCCASIIFFGMVFTVFAVGPALETLYFPVVSKLWIEDIRPTADGRTEVRASFRKLRNCEYMGISWYAGTPATTFERVAIILLRDEKDTSGPTRPVGLQRAGPWIINLPPDGVKRNSFARLYHHCHPFWVTTTDFFP
ncbi:exported hypothetical protein [uncultured Pleomorphomonas sp.]|uniref:Uncharacterized protein n=1 Tax=uncultured Pleomorphomonas sp. TaxID=442121 RepID=A0A212LR20_9HYPH|nr:hypothetical protein [uncultured Pleomorphomonas sp.]SCM80024.1 exported hypothetical protein [uncultured Pleomorphomonas sp.]